MTDVTAENPTRKNLILLADDEEEIRFIGQRLLEMDGFRVVTAEDGNAALDLFQEIGAEVACVFLDLSMPGLDGAEALEQIRKISPVVPIVLTSGFSEEDLREKVEGGVNTSFLQKPFTRDNLIGKAREMSALAS